MGKVHTSTTRAAYDSGKTISKAAKREASALWKKLQASPEPAEELIKKAVNLIRDNSKKKGATFNSIRTFLVKNGHMPATTGGSPR